MEVKKRGHVSATDVLIGQKLKYLRLERNMTQKDVADVLDVTIQRVQKYEKGTNRLSLVSFIKLAHSLSFDILQFLDIKQDNQEFAEKMIVDDALLKITSRLSRIDTGTLAILCKFFESLTKAKR